MFQMFEVPPDQPASIATFERLMLGFLLASAVVVILMYQHMLAHVGRQASLISLALSFGIAIVLSLLISRRRSNIARWLLAVGSVLALAPYVAHFPDLLDNRIAGIASVIQLVLLAAAIRYLFARQSRDWFAGRLS